MSVRIPEEMENITISVFLKDGHIFLDKDITDKPFGDYEITVTFWDDDKLIAFPMNEVKRIEMNFKGE